MRGGAKREIDLSVMKTLTAIKVTISFNFNSHFRISKIVFLSHLSPSPGHSAKDRLIIKSSNSGGAYCTKITKDNIKD